MHSAARPQVDAFLAALDAAAPGWAEGLYLTGSLALDDFRPGQSDVDFLAIGARALSGAEAEAVIAAAPGLRAFDGLFLTWDDLAAGPDALRGRRLHLHEGRAALEDAASLADPIAWATLAQSGIAARGPAPGAFSLWHDDARARSWIVENLNLYWRRRQRAASHLLSPAGLQALSPWFAQWSTLGPARMLATLETGKIVSKTEAGRWAIAALDPRWTPVLEEALRLRTGEGAPRFPSAFARRRAVLDFMDMAIRRAKV